MRHFTKISVRQRGVEVFRLIDQEGDPVSCFDAFVQILSDKDFSPRTIKRYLEVVSGFLDYLSEARVFGNAVSALALNDAVNSYIPIRIRADNIRAVGLEAASTNSIIKDQFVAAAHPIVGSLNYKSVEPSASMSAAINLFLRQSELLVDVEWQRCEIYGINRTHGSNRDVVNAISGMVSLPRAQSKALKQASMLANIIRMMPSGIMKPRGLSGGKGPFKFPEEKSLDFPILHFSDVIDAANSWRDRALWLLIGGCGLRTSEAANLRWEHISIPDRTVYVADPNGLRYAANLLKEGKLRFKGRNIATTYMLPFIRDRFFEALENYVKNEYIPGAGRDYVFQSIRLGPEYGQPLWEMSDSARIENFKRAVNRANIKSPVEHFARKTLTPHSLRHMYGVYLANYLPVPGGYGLTLKEVQKLMGQKTAEATEHYARKDGIILASKLEYADQFVIQDGDNWNSLPEMIAKRLRAEADKIERSGRF